VHNFGTCVWRTAWGAKNVFRRRKNLILLWRCRFSTQAPKLCTDLDLSLLYILIIGKYSKFARKNNFLALGVCFPQPCSSAGRRFVASRSRVQYYRRIIDSLLYSSILLNSTRFTYASLANRQLHRLKSMKLAGFISM